jgi:hypothetical protein
MKVEKINALELIMNLKPAISKQVQKQKDFVKIGLSRQRSHSHMWSKIVDFELKPQERALSDDCSKHESKHDSENKNESSIFSSELSDDVSLGSYVCSTAEYFDQYQQFPPERREA